MIIPVLVSHRDSYNCEYHNWRLDIDRGIWYCLNCDDEYYMDSPYQVI